MELKFLKADVIKNPSTGKDLEIIDKRPCVMAMVVDSKCEQTLMVKQFRAGCKDYIHEFPAGVVEPDQTPMDAMFAEVRQEVGIDRNDIAMIVNIGDFYSSVGWTNEIATLFFVQLKEEFTQHKQDLDEGESLEYEWISVNHVRDCYKGKPMPIKTAMLLEYFEQIRNEDL